MKRRPIDLFRLPEAARWYVYTLLDPRTGIIKYVGQTASPKERLYAHARGHNKHGDGKLSAWVLELKRLEMKPVMEVVEFASSRAEALAIEATCIRKLAKDGVDLLNSLTCLKD